ncbi:MAG: fibronectin type III domain-containing protein [Dictyoglomus sp.]|nr:fibronectin type III domain-containing protein [Dictyoglomus sp.]MDW8188570.1 fibronectin type III domain-containing protein [Dictyoglomus sp.]
MKKLKFLALILSIVLLGILISGCTPQPQQPTVLPPVAPSNLVATALSATEVNLEWKDNSNNEEGFKIERKKEGEDWIEIKIVSANVTSYIDTGLTPKTKYFYRIKAFNSAGSSAYSNEAEVTTLPPPLPAPSNLVAKALTGTEVKLEWKDNSDNEEGFKIERKKEGEDWGEIATISANVTTYIDKGLKTNTKYYYRVRAFNADGNSSWSNEAEVTTLVWFVYDWTNTVEPPTGWIEGSATYSMSTYCTIENGILKMDTRSLAAAVPSYRYNFGSPQEVPPGSLRFTLVFKAKGEVGIANVTRAWTLDIQTSLYRGGFEIETTRIRLLNGTGSLATSNLYTAADWHVYWLTFEYTLSGINAKVYVDGNPTPVLEGTINAAPSSPPDPLFMRLGDTSTSASNLYIGYIDWIWWTFDGCFAPGEVQIPEGFSLTP